MTSRTDLDRIIRGLETVLARGHGLIPVPHKDLRILLDAAKASAYVGTVGEAEDDK